MINLHSPRNTRNKGKSHRRITRRSTPPNGVWATRGDGLNSSTTWPRRCYVNDFLVLFVDEYQSRKSRVFNNLAPVKRVVQQEIDATNRRGAVRYNL